MPYNPGTQAPQSGYYWCTVCKLPAKFEAGQTLPTCKNQCGRGKWEFVRAAGDTSTSGEQKPKN